MKSNLALKLNKDSPRLDSFIVYFGGKSNGISDEIKQISEKLAYENATNVFYGFSNKVIVPVFELTHFHIGTMTKNVEKMVIKSQAYVEIIGDGFGDTSFDLAYSAFNIAETWKLPMQVFVKGNSFSDRKANNPKYAQSFLELVGGERITSYTTPLDAAVKVNDFLKQIFKI